MSDWIPTRKSSPCEVCGDTSGKCRSLSDGPDLLCMIETSNAYVPGFKFKGLTKNGLWGIWVPLESTQSEDDRWERERRQQEQLAREILKLTGKLSAAELDHGYRQLLGMLSLHPDDRADLHRRGFTDEQIEEQGFKSVERWQWLVRELSPDLPGVSADGRSLNVPYAGYICHIHDIDGLVVGIQIRVRNPQPGQPKYYWLTGKTRKRPNGPTPHLCNGELPLAIRRPPEVRTKGVAIVEGTGSKPLLTCLRLGMNTIGAAGGQHSGSPKQLREAIERLCQEAGEKLPIIFYVDAGSVQNPTVLRQLRRTWTLLRRWGYEVQIGWWGQTDKGMHPDIDELEDLSQIQLISVSQFEAIAHKYQRDLLCLDRVGQRLKKLITPKGFDQKPEERSPEEAFTAPIHEYEAGQRHQTWQQALQKGYRYIIDGSDPGTGKSHDSGNVQPDLFGTDTRQLTYGSEQHRNPSTGTLDQGWIDLEARNNGLTREKTVGGTRLKRVSGGAVPDIPGNCNRTQTINTLRSKGVSGADSANLICKTCPLEGACKNNQGPGFGYLNQRRIALSSPRLRGHPDSLPQPGEYDYTQVGLIWDEPGESFRVKKDINVTLKDVQAIVTALLSDLELLGTVQPLLTAIMGYLNGTVSTGRNGVAHVDLIQQWSHLVTGINPQTIDRLEQFLSPNLNFLNTTGEYGVDLTDLPAHLRKRFSDRDTETAAQTEEMVLKQWLPDLLRVIAGWEANGHIHIDRRTLTITLPDHRHRNIARATKGAVFLDATLPPEDLALKLGCRPDEIFVCRQRVEDTGNLTITQVTDLGRLGMQRGDDQLRRVAALEKHYRSLDPTTRVIDFKKYGADGAWWRDSRGVNDFQETNTLILVGTPCRNLNDLLAEHTVLTGCSNPDDPRFKAYCDRIIRADIIQAIGRLRAHRRPNEKLQIVLISDFDTGLSVQQVKACEVTPEAGSRSERTRAAIEGAIRQLQAQGKKATQVAVSAVAGIARGTIAHYWFLFKTLLEPINSKTNISQEDIEMVEGTASILEAIANSPPDQLLQSLQDIFLSRNRWLDPRLWGLLWQRLTLNCQVQILSALALTMPDRFLRRLVAIGGEG